MDEKRNAEASVTGSRRGIGLRIGVALGQAGFNVVLNGTSPAPAAEAAIEKVRSTGSGAAGLNAAVQLNAQGLGDVSIVTEGLDKGTSINAGSDKQTFYKLSMCGREMCRVLIGEVRRRGIPVHENRVAISLLSTGEKEKKGAGAPLP